ncbi:hypothetical protein ACFLTE_07405 [Bacteroidota bacterium]
MNKFFLIIILAFIIIFKGYTQDEKYYTIGIKTGYAKYAVYDELITPLIYSQKYIPFQFVYKEEHSKKLEITDISYTKLQLRPSATHPNYIDHTGIAMHYNHYRKELNYTKNRLNIIPGFGFTGYLYDNQQFYKTQAFSIDYLYNNKQYQLTFSINLSANIDFEINEKSKMNFTIDMPVIGYLVRPTYSARSNWKLSADNIKTINKYMLTNIVLDYVSLITKKLSFSVGLEANLYSVKFPYQYNSLTKSLKIGLYYAF